ncbi:MAG: site-specific integrase [Thermodesulfobacteriota bacterium]|jgi:integrase
MALLQECPKCKERLSLDYWEVVREGEITRKVKKTREKCSSCGFKLRKASGKVYWIEYYINGRRKRERIGPNKSAAEQRLREVLKARTEERYIGKDPAARLTLGELCKWYLELPEVKAKDSYSRDKDFISHLKHLLGEGTKIKDITHGKMEGYQKTRLAEPSPAHHGKTITPCEVNKEVTALKVIFNRSVRHGKLKVNSIANVKRLPENNIRQRVLTSEEFNTLLNACDAHIQPIVKMAYHMGMRKDEIIRLTWPEVDLKKGFIRLSAERTKTDTPRNIPIHPEVKVMLQGLPRGLHTDRVFLRNGHPFEDMKHSFQSACERAKIENFTFHDLRHCALNNLRKAGNDYFKIMAMSGHKTISVFKRYNLVTEEELAGIKWPKDGRIGGTLDTYMDTNEKKASEGSL